MAVLYQTDTDRGADRSSNALDADLTLDDITMLGVACFALVAAVVLLAVGF